VRRIGVIVIGLAALAATVHGPARAEPVVSQDRLNLGVVALDARIGADRVHSSGVVLDGDQGLVLTSAHAVWGATSLKIATALGVFHGRIVARAPCDDLALVETQPRLPGLAPLAAAPARAPDGAQLLTAVGRRRAAAAVGPESLLAIPLHAAAGGRVRIDPMLPPLAGTIRLDSALVPEASGGPIVDADGRVVGVAAVTGASHGGAVALPWPAIRRRLDQLRLDVRRLYVGWRDQYRCVGALHAFATAHHPGFRRKDARLNAPVPATRLPGTGVLDS
jgi:S1-C subfamily serine protease